MNWVVRRHGDIVLVMTWEPPYPLTYGKRPSQARFLPAMDEFKKSAFFRLHVQGTLVGFSKIGFDRWTTPYSSPNSWAYEFSETEGQDVIHNGCLMALGEIGLSFEDAAVDARLRQAVFHLQTFLEFRSDPITWSDGLGSLPQISRNLSIGSPDDASTSQPVRLWILLQVWTSSKETLGNQGVREIIPFGYHHDRALLSGLE